MFLVKLDESFINLLIIPPTCVNIRHFFVGPFMNIEHMKISPICLSLYKSTTRKYMGCFISSINSRKYYSSLKIYCPVFNTSWLSGAYDMTSFTRLRNSQLDL